MRRVREGREEDERVVVREEVDERQASCPCPNSNPKRKMRNNRHGRQPPPPNRRPPYRPPPNTTNTHKYKPVTCSVTPLTPTSGVWGPSGLWMDGRCPLLLHCTRRHSHDIAFRHSSSQTPFSPINSPLQIIRGVGSASPRLLCPPTSRLAEADTRSRSNFTLDSSLPFPILGRSPAFPLPLRFTLFLHFFSTKVTPDCALLPL